MSNPYDTIKAKINSTNSSTLLARINQGEQVQAKTVAVGPRTSLGDMVDIDMSQLDQGSVLIYDQARQVWLAKSLMDDGTYIECGHY